MSTLRCLVNLVLLSGLMFAATSAPVRAAEPAGADDEAPDGPTLEGSEEPQEGRLEGSVAASISAVESAARVTRRAEGLGERVHGEAVRESARGVSAARRAAGRRAKRRSEAWLVREYRTEGERLTDRAEAPETDGLPDPKPSAGEVLLWVPRVILYPVHLTAEYVVRWPLGRLLGGIEKYHVFERVVGALTFADGRAGFRPIVSFGGGRASSLGASFFYKEMADGLLDFDIGASGWPGRNTIARTRLTLHLADDHSVLQTRAGFIRRDDYVYFGVGQQPADRSEARFGEQTALGGIEWEVGARDDPGGAGLELAVVDRRGLCAEQATLDACGPDGVFGNSDDRFPVTEPQITDLGRDYTIARTDARVFWDSRPEHPGPGSGIRLEGFGGVSLGLGAASADLASVRYGAEISGFWDIFGAHQRTLGLRLRGEAADPIGDRIVPIGEVIALGGVETMRGFRENRLRGRSSLVATLDYRYPVWSFFEGEVFMEVGNVFGARWEDFSAGGLRGSAGIGLRSIDLLSRHFSYDINLSVGTAAFEDGFAVTEFRLNAGTNWGF